MIISKLKKNGSYSMKNILFCLIFFIPVATQAIELSVIGPCDSKPSFKTSFEASLQQSLGMLTVMEFERNKIPYLGNENGMHSILGMPFGDEALEIISDTKMRAYGLCFAVNGVVPDLLSNQVFLTKQSDKIVWFYAYSTYDRGQWLDYCVPSYNLKSQQFCD
jgi:hypothetical protein